MNMKPIMKLLVSIVAGLSLLSTTALSVADAAMIGTESAMHLNQRSEYINDIKSWLMRDSVKKQLVQLGVDPAAAGARVSAMTPQELRTLHERINSLPAGGDFLALIGAVFVVLIILELLGVTHVFRHI